MLNRKSNFICFDGENKGNKYFLLGNSESYIYNSSGLSSVQCLNFLSVPDKRKRIIFNLHYDIQFWVKDFNDKKILNLMESKKVKYKKFTLLYYPKKMLIIKKDNHIIKIYDILSFFNKSLLKTIELLNIELTDQEKKIISEGKLKRDNFDGMSLKKIIKYNRTECIVTERIAEKIDQLLRESYFFKDGRKENLSVNSFYGASSIANKILKTYRIDKLKKFKRYNKIFLEAYYGGRFEIFKIGEYKNLHKYDLNSAYPSVIKDLKSIKKFKVIKNIKNINDIKDESIYKIFYKHFYPKDFICPFPLRHKTGRIFFPKCVIGYYFGCELKALLQSGLPKDNYELIIYKGLEPVFGKKIFEDKNGYNVIEDIYNQRNYFKERKDIKQYIFKIALNSLYGKFAQRTGKHKYSNYYYAGYITASVRSRLLIETYKTECSNILFFATDSILSKKKLSIKQGSGLGEWSYEYCTKSNILLSGLYKLQSERKEYYGLRGYNVTNQNFDKIISNIKKYGKSVVILKTFISHKLAIKDKYIYKDKRLLFVPAEKIIDVVKGNFKRKYFFDKNYQSDKSYCLEIYPIKSVPLELKESNDVSIIDY